MRAIDFLKINLPYLAPAVIALIVGMFLSWPANGILFAICASFLLMSFLNLRHVKKERARIDYTVYGADVILNGYNVYKSDLISIFNETIADWAKALNEDSNKVEQYFDGKVIEFKEHPLITTFGKFAGYYTGRTAVVGYKENLRETAFAHELGHIIHHVHFNMLDNDKCHEFMRENNLP